MKKLSALSFCLILNLLGCLTAYSQKITLVNEDTLICFTSNQSKFLLKEVYRAEMLDTLLQLELKTSEQKTSQIQLLENSIDLLRLKERNLNEIILNQDAIKTTYESDIKRLRRQLYFQKVQKTIFGGVGLLTSGLFLYLYVTK
jgi:hypothetical protein